MPTQYVTVFREVRPRWIAAARSGDVVRREVVADSFASDDEAAARAAELFPGREVFVLPRDKDAFAAFTAAGGQS